MTPAMPVLDLYNTVRTKFPAISDRADRVHVAQWGELDPELAYSWFESLASALNAEMRQQVAFAVHAPLFDFISGTLAQADDAVLKCIDVAFVENLFWQVPSAQCAAYWQPLPQRLKALYLAFHRREPSCSVAPSA